ncbi:MAG: DUF2889 domain-containing protein [Deltaproteobacteria bacterium]|nr:DUF2889 domain-containing protein [Deltaproteobacteria bacterium]
MNCSRHCHSRNISIRCYDVSDDLMTVEGSLKDDRLYNTDNEESVEYRDKDTIHHILVKMDVSIPQLTILAISAELSAIPNEACRGAKNCVNKLIGLQIKHGFTDAVRNLLANSEGCAHIMNLILSMGSAAVQGAWSALSRRTERGKMPSIDEAIMINSCWLWREDGPLAKKMKHNSK